MFASLLNVFGYAVAIIGFFLTLLLLAPLWIQWRAARPETLTAEEAAATHFRFFYSKHVTDLKLVFWSAYVLFFFLLAIFVYLGFRSALSPILPKDVAPIHAFFDAFSVFPAVALALGAVVAWSYRTAGLRLGVVDLFACEINSLCRVGTIVDVASTYVNLYELSSHDGTNGESTEGTIESKEEYFPVFNSNAKDLQVLEAGVVTDITAFYTYMKAFRDTRRVPLPRLSIPIDSNYSNNLSDNERTKDVAKRYRAQLFRIVYMLFLGYESARKATADLIEFQPTRAECIIVIMITELKCFSLLVDYCTNYLGEADIRYLRLDLRKQDYRIQAAKVRDKLLEHSNCETIDSQKEWRPAYRLLNELRHQYKTAINEDL